MHRSIKSITSISNGEPSSSVTGIGSGTLVTVSFSSKLICVQLKTKFIVASELPNLGIQLHVVYVAFQACVVVVTGEVPQMNKFFLCLKIAEIDMGDQFWSKRTIVDTKTDFF